jgi:catechol 2,3-dioxygenase-like lactoylglutathione lyase family enzyme
MKVRPILFVADLPETIRFYEALGLEVQAQSRSSHWLELRASGGELGLHGPVQGEEVQPGMRLGFVAEEPLEEVEQRLRAAGFPPEGRLVDQEWGRSLLVRGPDGAAVQIDEQDRELYT